MVLIVLAYGLFRLFLILKKGFVQTKKDSHISYCFPISLAFLFAVDFHRLSQNYCSISKGFLVHHSDIISVSLFYTPIRPP